MYPSRMCVRSLSRIGRAVDELVIFQVGNKSACSWAFDYRGSLARDSYPVSCREDAPTNKIVGFTCRNICNFSRNALILCPSVRRVGRNAPRIIHCVRLYGCTTVGKSDLHARIFADATQKKNTHTHTHHHPP